VQEKIVKATHEAIVAEYRVNCKFLDDQRDYTAHYHRHMFGDDQLLLKRTLAFFNRSDDRPAAELPEEPPD
jgi:hypothetical protein